MSCRGLATLTIARLRPPTDRRARSPRGALHGLHGHDRTVLDGHGLADVERRSVGHLVAELKSCCSWARAGCARLTDAGCSSAVESMSSMPRLSTLATAPIGPSVFFDASCFRTRRKVRSGRYRRQRAVCLTCPAITACATPASSRTWTCRDPRVGGLRRAAASGKFPPGPRRSSRHDPARGRSRTRNRRR